MVQYIVCFVFGVLISLFSHWFSETYLKVIQRCLAEWIHSYIVNRYE